MRAIVWTGEVEMRDDVELRAPLAHEVKVRIHRAGVCHSDVSLMEGMIPWPTPSVMGHEGAGIVEEVGAAVRKVKVGDHVVLTTVGNCGKCPACAVGKPTHCRDTFGQLHQPFTLGASGELAYQFASLGLFGEYTVVDEAQAVVIGDDVPFEVACLIGCAVVTGTGAVFNRAKVERGQSVVVIGAGGIGQSVIQAARIAGASRIVVVDSNPGKEAISRTFGANDFVNGAEVSDVVSAVKDLGLPNGADHVFECVGHPALIANAIDLLDWGGTCTLLGVPKFGTEASFVVQTLYNDKSILGCRYGSTRPHHDIPMLVDYYRDGRLMLDEMVSRVYPMSDFALAVADMKAGVLNRGVLAI